MTTALTLPALDGRDPLGFLAALGTIRLLTDHDQPDTRLSFDDRTGTSVLHSRCRTIDAVVDTLTSIRDQIDDGAVLPGLDAGFPRAAGKNGGDPTRMPRLTFREQAAHLPDADNEKLRWLSVLVTDLAVDANQRCRATPYTAPTGKQSVRSFFEKSLTGVRNYPNALHQALTAWQWIDTITGLDAVTGENLDYRALRFAADQPDGTSRPAAVPGAVWLATMALPLLRLTGNGTTARAATGWHPDPTRPGQHLMIWPIWRPPLDTHAIQALLEHPALKPTVHHGQPAVDGAEIRALGVFHVVAAVRRPYGKSEGTLTPVPLSTSVSG